MIKIKRQVAALMLGLGIVFSALPAAPAQAASPNSAIARTKKQILSMSDAIEKKEQKIESLTDSIFAVGDEIRQNETDIAGFTSRITQTIEETEQTKKVLAQKQGLYGKRLREIYKNGNISALAAVLDAKNISDFLLRYKVVQTIARHDKDLIDSIASLKLQLEEKTVSLQTNRKDLENATSELKANEARLDRQKTEQVQELAGLKSEKADLRQLLESQEVALFEDIERILNSPQSSESDVKEALAILATIQSQVSTPDAIAMGKQLNAKGNELAKKLKQARLEAERLAREKAEAERQARELEAKRQAAQQQKKAEEARKLAAQKQRAAERAAQKEKERQAAQAKSRQLEKEKQAQEAASARLAAKEAETKKAADKAKKLSAYATTKKTSSTKTSSKSNNLTFYLSFYTDLPEENGGWTITATGDKLVYGIVANNVWPMYTKIYLEGWGTMTVKDRGGKDFYSRYRLDVFIPRRSGESNRQYLYRVNMMGRKTVKGRVLD